jgi:hypothetical protein
MLHAPCLYFAKCAALKPVALHFKLPVHGTMTHTLSMLTQTHDCTSSISSWSPEDTISNLWILGFLFTVCGYVHVMMHIPDAHSLLGQWHLKLYPEQLLW